MVATSLELHWLQVIEEFTGFFEPRINFF